ncbi:MAG TPA: hypothetical protein VFL57_10295 [Bryobacteraceae bacterium]|nr:hypothetical protein [Bryobacteraceae bacterium]
MRILVAALLLAGAAAAQTRVSRVSLAAMEASFDRRVLSVDVTDPFMLLGTTRGLYLSGYGAVFTAEVNLIASAVNSPFRPEFTKQEIARIRQKKQYRVTLLKQHMRNALIGAAASLDGVPINEQIVLGVSLFYFNWEDRSGLPAQVVMQAPKKALLEAGKGNPAPLEAVLQVQEY